MNICEKCNKEFYNKYSLLKHQNIKVSCNNRNKTCVCGKIFRDSYDLKRHQANKTSCLLLLEPIPNGEIKCQCGKIYTSNSNLLRHQKTCNYKQIKEESILELESTDLYNEICHEIEIDEKSLNNVEYDSVKNSQIPAVEIIPKNDPQSSNHCLIELVDLETEKISNFPRNANHSKMSIFDEYMDEIMTIKKDNDVPFRWEDMIISRQ
jgi:hypothetical protein